MTTTRTIPTGRHAAGPFNDTADRIRHNGTTTEQPRRCACLGCILYDRHHRTGATR